MKNRNFLAAVSMLVALSLVSIAPVYAQASQPSEKDPSRISGKIVSADGKPIAGAKVMAYHLSTGKLYEAEPSGPNGSYVLPNLPYGYFDLAVETEAGVFAGNQVVNLAPASKAVVNFTTVEFGAGDPAARNFPGSEEPSTGMARVREKVTGRAFWSSAKGVAILTGGGAIGLLAIAANSDDDNTSAASPFSP